MTPKREGPFKIEEVLGPITYRLKMPDIWKIHNVFHAVLLKPYQENDIHPLTIIPNESSTLNYLWMPFFEEKMQVLQL